MFTPRSPGDAGMAAPCQPSASSVESSGHTEPDPGLALFPVIRSSLLARRRAPFRACRSHLSPVTRRTRKMTPTEKKDDTYWDKRRKNNEAAKRSRDKRRLKDLMLEGQLLAVSEENAQLRARVLNLQCHTSTLPSPAHTTAFFQAGLWANSRSSAASVVGVRQQETAMHQLEIPCFSLTRGVGVFNPLNRPSCETQQGICPLSGPRVPSPRGALGRSAEVSSSDDISVSTHAPSLPFSPVPAFLPTPDTLQHASTLPYPLQNWQGPHLNHSAVCNNLLLPWWSSCLPPPAVYPGLPLHVEQGLGLSVEAHIQRGFKSRFSGAPSAVFQLGMHLSPDGR